MKETPSREKKKIMERRKGEKRINGRIRGQNTKGKTY